MQEQEQREVSGPLIYTHYTTHYTTHRATCRSRSSTRERWGVHSYTHTTLHTTLHIGLRIHFTGLCASLFVDPSPLCWKHHLYQLKYETISWKWISNYWTTIALTTITVSNVDVETGPQAVTEHLAHMVVRDGSNDGSWHQSGFCCINCVTETNKI